MFRWLTLGLALVSLEPPRLYYVLDAYNVTIAGDSLKFALFWTQPADSLGKADSTVYVVHVSKATRFYSDTLTRSAGVRIRRRFGGATACSVPGSFAISYVRRTVPPPMTVVRIVHDSF